MDDREKVYKGLECCKRKDGNECKVCPYTENEYCTEDMAMDTLALLKEQEAAYQGAEELLRQKTILFDDAIKRLKEQEDQIKNRDESLEKAREEIKWLRGRLKEQEVQPKTVPEELKLKMWNALYAVEDKFEEKYIGTKEQDSWFLIYRPWLQEGFDLAIKAIADWEGQ